LIILYLLYLSYRDIKTYHLNDLQIIVLFLITLLTNNFQFSFIFLIVLVTAITVAILYENYIGTADLKIISILTLTYHENMIFILLVASSIAIITILFSKNCDYLPFIPFITLGVIIFQISINLILI
jgi:hypothetical protein